MAAVVKAFMKLVRHGPPGGTRSDGRTGAPVRGGGFIDFPSAEVTGQQDIAVQAILLSPRPQDDSALPLALTLLPGNAKRRPTRVQEYDSPVHRSET